MTRSKKRMEEKVNYFKHTLFVLALLFIAGAMIITPGRCFEVDESFRTKDGAEITMKYKVCRAFAFSQSASTWDAELVNALVGEQLHDELARTLVDYEIKEVHDNEDDVKGLLEARALNIEILYEITEVLSFQIIEIEYPDYLIDLFVEEAAQKFERDKLAELPRAFS